MSVNCNNLRIKSAFFQKAIKNCVNVKPAWFTLTQFIYIVFYKERGDSNAVSISLSEKQLRYAVANKLHGLYIIQKVYKYWEKEDGDNYLYLKQVTSIYSKTDDSLVGGPWTNYNKFRQR